LRTAAARPLRWIATWPIWVWWKSCIGYPLDGVVLTTGCDKTTPAALMAAATVDMPAIVLSGGPMLDSHSRGELAGSGTVVWQCRQKFAAGEITRRVPAGRPGQRAFGRPLQHDGHRLDHERDGRGPGHVADRLRGDPGGLPRTGQMAYRTGRRAVEIVHEDLRPSHILTRAAFLNAIRVSSALGGSTNAQPHLAAMADHAGVALAPDDWQNHGHDIPLLADVQPAGRFLGERFHRAGGVPAIMHELLAAGKLDDTCSR
jgi:xylonate dehydratase